MPTNYDILRQQKLLSMYRALLAAYLRQHEQWVRPQIPVLLSTSISVLRGHILEVKGRLRGWKIEVHDHSDDQDPNDDRRDEIQHQRELLKIHRRNLATYLAQQKQLPIGQSPPILVNSLDHIRSEIQRIKAILRGWRVTVDDLPEEEIE